MLEQLQRLPVRRASVRPLLAEAWTLRHNLRGADAMYVVLARHLGADLVALDTRMSKASGMNVRIVSPPTQ
jgi:predicted nucleic acid-binding protein